MTWRPPAPCAVPVCARMAALPGGEPPPSRPRSLGAGPCLSRRARTGTATTDRETPSLRRVGAMHALPLRISPNRATLSQGARAKPPKKFIGITRPPGVRASSPQAARMAALPGSGRASGPRRGPPNRSREAHATICITCPPGVRASSPQAARMAALPGKEGGFRGRE